MVQIEKMLGINDNFLVKKNDDCEKLGLIKKVLHQDLYFFSQTYSQRLIDMRRQKPEMIA